MIDINELKILYYDKQLNMRTLIGMVMDIYIYIYIYIIYIYIYIYIYICIYIYIYIIHVCKNEIYLNLLSIMTRFKIDIHVICKL